MGERCLLTLSKLFQRLASVEPALIPFDAYACTAAMSANVELIGSEVIGFTNVLYLPKSPMSSVNIILVLKPSFRMRCPTVLNNAAYASALYTQEEYG